MSGRDNGKSESGRGVIRFFSFSAGNLFQLLVLISFIGLTTTWDITQAQDRFPPPPADRSLVYLANEQNKLEPVAFETGTTPLRTDAVAGNNKSSYIELKGATAARTISNPLPRFYVFVRDEANVHPPFIVRLKQTRGGRRVTAMAQKGLKGFAIYSEEIVKPLYRVLSRSNGVIYMEISPRESLAPGEYAIIGSDLERVATFRISQATGQ